MLDTVICTCYENLRHVHSVANRQFLKNEAKLVTFLWVHFSKSFNLFVLIATVLRPLYELRTKGIYERLKLTPCPAKSNTQNATRHLRLSHTIFLYNSSPLLLFQVHLSSRLCNDWALSQEHDSDNHNVGWFTLGGQHTAMLCVVVVAGQVDSITDLKRSYRRGVLVVAH
jgi:hypothetical protein